MNKKPVGTTYVCGAQIEYKGDIGVPQVAFALSPMGQFGTVEEAVIANAGLHWSFGFDIYEVEDKVIWNIVRSTGFAMGRKACGFKVIRLVCRAYDHPAWPGQGKEQHTQLLAS